MSAVELSAAPSTTPDLPTAEVGPDGRTAHRPGWTCENCAAQNPRARKRCEDCGTSRD